MSKLLANLYSSTCVYCRGHVAAGAGVELTDRGTLLTLVVHRQCAELKRVASEQEAESYQRDLAFFNMLDNR